MCWCARHARRCAGAPLESSQLCHASPHGVRPVARPAGDARRRQGLPRSLAGALAAAGGNAAAAAAPFYANGWRAFMDAPALAADCPPPDALAALDDTRALLAALEAALVGGARRGAAPPGWGDTADALTKAGTPPALLCGAARRRGPRA